MDIFCLQNPQKKKKKKIPPKKHGEFLNPQGKTSYKIVYIASHQNRFETLRRLMADGSKPNFISPRQSK
jgi:hypothetical protein